MKSNAISVEELNKLSKETIVTLYLQQMETLHHLQEQNDLLLAQMKSLQEKIDVLTQQRFGRKTEKLSAIDPDQLQMDLTEQLVLNEAEVYADLDAEVEPDDIIVRRKRPKGKRKEDLGRLELVVDPTIVIPDAKLSDLFPKGYTRLDDYIYTDVEYIPAQAVAHEHHLAVYAGKHNEGVVRADMPERLLKNSILTPSLAAAVINGKYVNALPLNRISEEFKRNDVNISRQVLANWMISLTQRYLIPVYRQMHKAILQSQLIHCDETPFKLIRDGKPNPNSKCYMWVYHSYERYGTPPIYLYEYQPTRNSKVLKNFLGDYKGILVTDGYQVYHSVAKQHPDDLTVAGCWTHAKRKFAELVKSLESKDPISKTAAEAVSKISNIYHMDNLFKEKPAEEILNNRIQVVTPLVDSYFAWVKQCLMLPMDKSGNLYSALKYSVNQEPYLRAFLSNPMIPLDNNDAERSIRKFCIGKHNWYVIDSPNGAESSAILYSIAETAKANGLRPYNYFVYLFESLLAHLDDSPSEYIDDLLPWSDKIPKNCRAKN